MHASPFAMWHAPSPPLHWMTLCMRVFTVLSVYQRAWRMAHGAPGATGLGH